MLDGTRTKPAASFWIISIVALLWNLSGVASFFMESTMSEAALAKLPDAERALHENTPNWLYFFYGLAVIAGTLGCILLLARKGFAFSIFIISLIAVLIQMSYSVFLTEAMEVYGAVSVIMPLVVIGIGVFLIWYSKHSARKGWIA